MKDYIITNTEERKKADSEFKKYFYKLMCNAVFGKSMEQVRNHRYIRLVTTDKKRCQLVSEPNYHTIKRFSEDLVVIEMRKTEIKMNKPIYLGLAILDISKTLMYEFWYDYLKPKYDNIIGLCYVDTDSFIFHVETEDFYKDISNDANNRFDTSAYSKDLNRPLPIGKNKKVLGMMKDELCGKVMTHFCALRAKTYSYFMMVKKKTKLKEQKSVLLKKKIKFDDYRAFLFNNNPVLRCQEVLKCELHDVYTVILNKIALNSNDDKRLQTYDKIATYPYGFSVGKVCKTELLNKVKQID